MGLSPLSHRAAKPYSLTGIKIIPTNGKVYLIKGYSVGVSLILGFPTEGSVIVLDRAASR